jgi:hypothetical protein
MRQHTLVFSTELGLEDVATFEDCHGVIGASAHRNVLNVYTQHPVGPREQKLFRRTAKRIGRTIIGADLQAQAL